MVDCASLENWRAERFRGFESLPLRHSFMKFIHDQIVASSYPRHFTGLITVKGLQDKSFLKPIAEKLKADFSSSQTRQTQAAEGVIVLPDRIFPLP